MSRRQANQNENQDRNRRNMGKHGEKKSRKKKHGKRKLYDIMMNLVVFAAFLILAVVIGYIIWTGVRERMEKKASEPETTQEAEATPTATSNQEGITTYICKISSGEEVGNTDFVMEFNSNDMTYTEKLQAGTESNDLDQGTYEIDDQKIITRSTETEGTEVTYLLDGDYLLAEAQMYQGIVPEDAGDTFEGEFTYDILRDNAKMGETSITFKKDGTYAYKTVTYGDKDSSEEDSVSKEKGTYQKTGKWISRTTEAGEEKLSYYIYQGQITNAYYVKE